MTIAFILALNPKPLRDFDSVGSTEAASAQVLILSYFVDRHTHKVNAPFTNFMFCSVSPPFLPKAYILVLDTLSL
jgi:hypothetical protein